MRITLQRTGGFTGIPMTKSIDGATMSADELSRLRDMVDKTRFFQMPPVISGAPQPDRFQYQILIERDGKQHRVTVDETVVPLELKPLLDWLIKQPD